VLHPRDDDVLKNEMMIMMMMADPSDAVTET
jgi:hypothetical protein